MQLALALLLLKLSDPVEEIDRLAQARDVEGVARYAVPSVRGGKEAFRFLKRNGAYDTGRYGWRAFSLSSVDGSKRYVVFSTPLTSEDLGEQVFEWDGSRLSRYVPETETFGHRIARQSLEVWFDIPAKTARIEGTVQFAKTDGAKPAFMVRFGPNYRVSSVIAQSGESVKFAQAGGVVSLPSASSPSFTYRIAYSGVVNKPAYAGSISPNEAMLTNDSWYPMIARFPCAYDLTAHTPMGWTAVGQGEESPPDESGGDRVTRFRMELPVTYWSFSAAPYKSISETMDGRKIAVWSLTLPEEKMRIQAELSRPILEFYSKFFGPYPFTRWGAVDSPHYGGGALEAYSFATYGTGWLPDEDAHEPAHTWWGGIINNTYLKSLWNESFATFSEGLYNRECPIGNSAERRVTFVSDATPSPAFDQAPLSNAGAWIGPVASALGYGKGAMVMQMLEAELGTPLMVKTMQEWLRSHPKGDPGEWEDYERAVKRATGRDYKWFFDQWVRRPGYPNFEISNVKWRDGQVHAVARFKGPKYWLTMDVMLQYADGSREFKTCKIGPTPDSDASFPTVIARRKPVLVSFDPWRRLLRRYGNDETPVQLEETVRRAAKVVDPAHTDWLTMVGASKPLQALPADLSGVFVVGSPESLPAIKPLFEKVGFKVSGNKLTYDGATIDLNEGGAMAVVDLGGGKRCAIGLGKVLRHPSYGRARLCVFDRYGRFLRGKTEPKTSGFLTLRL